MVLVLTRKDRDAAHPGGDPTTAEPTVLEADRDQEPKEAVLRRGEQEEGALTSTRPGLEGDGAGPQTWSDDGTRRRLCYGRRIGDWITASGRSSNPCRSLPRGSSAEERERLGEGGALETGLRPEVDGRCPDSGGKTSHLRSQEIPKAPSVEDLLRGRDALEKSLRGGGVWVLTQSGRPVGGFAAEQTKVYRGCGEQSRGRVETSIISPGRTAGKAGPGRALSSYGALGSVYGFKHGTRGSSYAGSHAHHSRIDADRHGGKNHQTSAEEAFQWRAGGDQRPAAGHILQKPTNGKRSAGPLM